MAMGNRIEWVVKRARFGTDSNIRFGLELHPSKIVEIASEAVEAMGSEEQSCLFCFEASIPFLHFFRTNSDIFSLSRVVLYHA
jgi:hypothetical protein